MLVQCSSMSSLGADEPVRRGVGLGLVVIGDATDNDRPNSPKHLQHLRRRSSQSQGHNFSAVGGCVGDKNAPWDTFQDLGREEHSLAVAEIEDEDEGIQEHETADGCPSVSNPTGDGTRDENADEGTDRSAALEGGLPRSFDDPFLTFLAVHAEILGELSCRDELSHQENTVRLHDLSRR